MNKQFRDVMRSLYWSCPGWLTTRLQEVRFKELDPQKIYLDEFDSLGCIYIHIPKVAGKSISHAIFGKDPMHHTYREFYRTNPHKCISYWKFSFVRNPWDRLFSIYNYLSYQNSTYPYGKYRWLNKYPEFSSFVMNGLNTKLVENDIFFLSQYNYLKSEDGGVSVDFIGRFETINNNFDVVKSRLRVGADLPMIGKGRQSLNYKDVYTEDMIARVGDVYSDDVRYFKYDFY